MPLVREGRKRRTKRVWWRRPSRMALLVVMGLLLAAGLSLIIVRLVKARAPAGQVIATVDGVEVTLQDVLAEGRAQDRMGRPADRARDLETVVSRQVLARTAVARGLTREATYPADRARADAQLLAEEFIRRSVSAPSPGPLQIAAYVTAHPAAFADRRAYVLDRLDWMVRRGGEVAAVPDLESLKSELVRNGVRFREAVTAPTSDELRPELAERLAVSPPGAVTIVRDGTQATALTVLSSTAEAVSGAAARVQARSLLENELQRTAVSDMLSRLKRLTPVRYQRGYAPADARSTGELR